MSELRFCSRCGRLWVYCNCRKAHINDDGKIDISFDLWVVDKFHYHKKQSLMVTKDWEDIAALMCENLITITKYAAACNQNDEKIIKNETMHDYILTRIENIERSYSCLLLMKKINEEEFNYFEKNQKTILFMLTGEGEDIDNLKSIFKEANWKDEHIFKDYIKTILNSDFFKRNDIRIE